MFNLAEMAMDPDFSSCLTIIRSSGRFVAGEWRDVQAEIPTVGTVVIADDEALSQVPEGDRVTGSLQLVCSVPIYETRIDDGPEVAAGLSDMIRWKGNLYRVQKVQPWDQYLMWSAILVRMTGA